MSRVVISVGDGRLNLNIKSLVIFGEEDEIGWELEDIIPILILGVIGGFISYLTTSLALMVTKTRIWYALLCI